MVTDEGVAEQTITSLEVAELTGKNHKDVLRDIRNILSQMDEINQPNFRPVKYTDAKGEDGAGPNFRLSEYKDTTGRTLPCYRLTKEGCLCLVSGYDANLRMKHSLAGMWRNLRNCITS